jgi:hypothetical protein
MHMHNLILLDCGDIQQTSLHQNLERAQNALYDFVCENWHDEDSSPEDHSASDAIEWFFEHYEDYRYYIDTVHVPDAPAGEDVILTPGMCRIIREALGEFNFDIANVIVLEEGEEELGSGGDAIGALIQQFS